MLGCFIVIRSCECKDMNNREQNKKNPFFFYAEIKYLRHFDDKDMKLIVKQTIIRIKIL